MSKHCILINGTMGVGKTTVCKELMQLLPASVFLDGDWCWYSHPFTVTEQTKQVVMENIGFMLQNFLKCPDYQNIIFCWVMDHPSILDEVISRIETALEILLSFVLHSQLLPKLFGNICKKTLMLNCVKKIL